MFDPFTNEGCLSACDGPLTDVLIIMIVWFHHFPSSMFTYHCQCLTGNVCFQGGYLNYPYTEHLLELERQHPPNKSTSSAMCFEGVSASLVVDQWAKFLRNHPDTDYRDYLLKGLQLGFHIGFDYANHTHKSAKANIKSAQKNRELACNRFTDPINPLFVMVNRSGVIPKRPKPERWRLITDLSHPPGLSINDGIEPSFVRSTTYQ